MFDRHLYKKNARMQLAGRWMPMALLTLMCTAITGALALPGEVYGEAELLVIAIHGILHTAFVYVALTLMRGLHNGCFSTFLGGLERWLHAMLGTLWYMLWVCLWSCLFVIPGIVKAVSYSQMFFVIAENPDVSPTKAMRISKIMTQGHKADLCAQALSFLPWIFLCSLTGGIGFLWLIPYMTQSFANAYVALKAETLATGKMAPADFE